VVSCLTGCAVTGPTTASGANSVAVGGSSSVNVSTALGTDVVKAITDSVAAYLGGLPKPVTAVQQKQAADAGTKAGVSKAQGGARTPDDARRAEIQKLAAQAVQDYLKSLDKP